MIRWIFSHYDTSRFPARWDCGDWPAVLGWRIILASITIGLLYQLCAVAVWYFGAKWGLQRKTRRTMEAIFVLCGTTHLTEALIYYWPVYPFLADQLFVLVLLLLVFLYLAATIERDFFRSSSQANEAKAELHAIANSATNPFFIVNRKGVCTFVSDSMCQLLGYDRDEILGREMHPLIHYHRPDGTEYPMDDCEINRAMLVDAATSRDVDVMWGTNKKRIDCRWTSTPILLNGEVIRSRVEVVPWTPQTLIDHSSRETSGLPLLVASMSAAIRSFPLAVVIQDSHDKVLAVSQLACEVLRKSEPELLGQVIPLRGEVQQIKSGDEWTKMVILGRDEQ